LTAGDEQASGGGQQRDEGDESLQGGLLWRGNYKRG